MVWNEQSTFDIRSINISKDIPNHDILYLISCNHFHWQGSKKNSLGKSQDLSKIRGFIFKILEL